jgi:DNA-binding transcriptional MerR regulator
MATRTASTADESAAQGAARAPKAGGRSAGARKHTGGADAGGAGAGGTGAKAGPTGTRARVRGIGQDTIEADVGALERDLEAGRDAGAARRKSITIGAVCKALAQEFPDISISKIRYLEDQKLLTPRRTPGGYRLYTQSDVVRLRTILRLQRDEFLPLRVIRQELASGRDDGADTPAAVPRESPRPRRAGIGVGSDSGARFSLQEVLEDTKADAKLVRELEEYGVIKGEHATRTGAAGATATAAGLAGAGTTAAGAAAGAGGTVAGGAGAGAAAGRAVGQDGEPATGLFYDETEREIIKAVAELARYGVGGRNLRVFRSSADREAGLLQQILAPALRSRNPQRRKEALEALENLAAVTTHLRHLLLVRDLRKIAG